jgi:hypothetical protein
MCTCHALIEPAAIVSAALQFDGQPGAIRKTLAQPPTLSQGCVDRRQPQGQAVIETRFEISGVDVVAAFDGAPPCAGDQSADLGVAALLRRQQYQLQAIAAAKLGTDDQPAAALLWQSARRLIGAHHTRKRTLVGQRQRAIAQFMRTRDEFSRMRGAAQKAEIAEAMQFGVVAHAIQPRRRACLRRSVFWKAVQRGVNHGQRSPP